MDLQNTFYIVGLVYMTVAILLLLALLIMVIAVRKKVVRLHERMEHIVHTLQYLTGIVTPVFTMIRQLVR